jgi:hypothetical protein
VPGAYDAIGSFTGFGGVKIPGALMRAIVESNSLSATLTRYSVPGWGDGELWMADEVVLAHDFIFAREAMSAGDTRANPPEGAGGASADPLIALPHMKRRALSRGRNQRTQRRHHLGLERERLGKDRMQPRKFRPERVAPVGAALHEARVRLDRSVRKPSCTGRVSSGRRCERIGGYGRRASTSRRPLALEGVVL